VVQLNAAIALAYADGAAAGLARLDALAGTRKLASYALYHAARGELLLRLERSRDASETFAKALACPVNGAERAYLEGKLQACVSTGA
jgi:RNA polymerase sigma-70 factor (ECF subfamily)